MLLSDEQYGQLLEEICCVCVHKPTAISKGDENTTKQLFGLGCSYGYVKGSKRYCTIARKSADAIVELFETNCKPLIRAKVAQEILGEIEKLLYPEEIILIGEATHGIKYPKHQLVIDKERWQELKREVLHESQS